MGKLLLCKFSVVVSLSLLFLFLDDAAMAQHFEYPKYRAKNAQDVEVESVHITDENTIIALKITNLRSKSVFFSSRTFIRDSDGGDSLYIQKVNGYLFGKVYSNFEPDEKVFEFYFPRIQDEVEAINFYSGEDGNFWRFFEIILNSGVGEDRRMMSGEKGVKDSCRYVISPGYTAKTGRFEIAKIELCDTVTVLYFTVNIPPGNSAFIPARSSIRDSRGGEDLFVKYAEGTNINKFIYAGESGNRTIYYKLFFPPIDKTVKKIDFREINTGGNWFAYELDVDIPQKK